MNPTFSETGWQIVRAWKNRRWTNTRQKPNKTLACLANSLKRKKREETVEEIKPNELNKYVCEFILSVKLEDYEPPSLRGLFASVNRFLNEGKYPVSGIDNKEFNQARKCLKARRKQLKKQSKGRKLNTELAYKQVNILYEKGLLGISSAEALVNTLWLLNSVHFGLRGCGDHRQMAWGDVKLLQETDGTEYLEFIQNAKLKIDRELHLEISEQ